MPVAQTRLECLQIVKLLQSVRTRDWIQTEKLISNGVPHLVNYTDQNDGELPLNLAASINDVEMVRFLLKHGANPDVVDSKGRTALVRATEKGNFECVDVLVKARADLNVGDLDGKGPLFYCLTSSEGHDRCAELLIRYGADVNNRSSSGLPILVNACEGAKTNEKLCLRLLEEGADPNSTDQKTYRTALMAASSSGSASVVKALLEKGCSVDSVSVRGTHAAHEAAKAGQTAILPLLSGWKSRMDVVDNEGNTPMHMAALGKHAKCCKFLFQRGCNPKLKNKDGYTAKMLAKEAKSKACVKECSRAEKSWGKTLKNCQAWAISIYDYCSQRKDHLVEEFTKFDADELGRIPPEVFVDILQESGAPIPENQTDLDGLISVHSKEKLVDYKLFLTGKKYISKRCRLSAFESKKKKKKKKRSRRKSKKRKTKIYLSIFAKPEGERSSDGGPPDPYIPRYIHLTDKTRFDDQRLPRHVFEDDSRWYCHPVERSNIRLNYAVKHSDMDSLMFSLKHRKDIANMRDNYNKTALMAAAYDGNMDMVKFLVDKGSDLNAKDNFNWTALHFACKSGHLSVIKYLLERGADLEAATFTGATPFMRAIESGKPEVVQFLLDKHVNLRVQTRKGKTPVDLAVAYADQRVLDLVKAACDKLPALPQSKAKKPAR